MNKSKQFKKLQNKILVCMKTFDVTIDHLLVHFKGSKVINRLFFHRKTVFHEKILSITNFANKLLSIKDYFVNGPQ